MVFIATTQEYEAGLDKKINSGTPYSYKTANIVYMLWYWRL